MSTGLSTPVSFFVKDTAERAGKTALQTIGVFIIPLILTGQFSAFHTDWLHVLDIGITGAILSLLTSFASQPVGNSNTASLVKPVPAVNAPAATNAPVTVPVVTG